jgi:hypothetical protein
MGRAQPRNAPPREDRGRARRAVTGATTAITLNGQSKVTIGIGIATYVWRRDEKVGKPLARLLAPPSPEGPRVNETPPFCGNERLTPGFKTLSYLERACDRARQGGQMTTFLQPDDAVDFAESGRRRGQDRVACFLHLRDLVYLHPEAASASTIALVQTLEAPVIAEKAAREKRLAAGRERAERRREADLQKAAAEQAKADDGGG